MEHMINKTDWIDTQPGQRCVIRTAAEETSGAYSVVEFISGPGVSVPVHVHQSEEEHYVVIEGVARFMMGDMTFDAGAGKAVTMPRNIPHAWGNPGQEPLRLLVTATPGGSERLLRASSPAEMMALAEEFGIIAVGPHLLGEPGNV